MMFILAALLQSPLRECVVSFGADSGVSVALTTPCMVCQKTFHVSALHTLQVGCSINSTAIKLCFKEDYVRFLLFSYEVFARSNRH